MKMYCTETEVMKKTRTAKKNAGKEPDQSISVQRNEKPIKRK